MRLHFIGTHHYNPRHRRQVTEAYERIFREDNGGRPPVFLAVEASEDQFKHIRDVERTDLRALVEKEWPKAPRETWDQLQTSLCFEGDAHQDSNIIEMRDARVIWLDDGDDRDPHGLAARWMTVLRQHVAGYPLEKDDQSDLEAKIAIACAAVDKLMEGADEKKDRDIKFAHRILNEVGARDEGWAAITVGKVHAANDCDRMRRLLQNAGYECADWWQLM